jgi:uncharacterized cupin superfamily protein
MINLISYRTESGKAPAVDPWPAIDGIQSGDPKQSAYTAFTSPDGSFVTGLWSCTPGKFSVTQTMNETCHILSGRVIVTTKNGKAQEFGTNDVIVMPAGWEGTWDIRATIRKVFALSATK